MMRHPLLWIIVGIMVVLSIFWERSPRDLLTAPSQDAEQRFPNAYMEEVETRNYNANGQLEYHLRASRVEHHQRNPRRAGPRDYTQFEQPFINFYGEVNDDPPWQLTAQQGRSDAEGTLISLDHNVRAWKESAEDELLELTTEQLILKPDEQYAETEKAVKMRSPQGVTEAVGMRALMNQDRIELLSEVKGRYEP